MPTLQDSLICSTTRPLRLTMRPDLSVREHQYQGATAWVIKDPVGLKYFRLQDEEYEILKLLDGCRSLEDLKGLYEAAFAPRKISHEDLAHYVGHLHQSGLVHSLMPDQGTQLKRRRDERHRQQLIAKLTDILALRFRGIDPHRLLDRLLPWTAWLYTPGAAVAASLLGLSALLLVLVKFSTVQARLPAFHEFFSAGNWIYLAVALAVTKVLHELGHGLSCRRFGGECHEIGLMMLVLTPCMYCDVSDSWMLKSKWQRAAIGAAGMYVELIIASLATLLWWNSAPGLLNTMMLCVMFVSSVSTVIFNANPLLRYDGYYILSDLLEIPNLRQKATTIVTSKLGEWCLGLEPADDRYLPQRGRTWFALYAVAAVLYRWMVAGTIVFFLCKVLEPYGLKVIGQLAAIFAVTAMLGQPLWSLKKYFSVPGRLDKIRPRRLHLTAGLIGMALAVFFFMPLPHRVHCALEVQPHEAAQVFVEVPGILREIKVRPGDKVAPGTVLAVLDNLDTRLEATRLQGDIEENQAKLNTLQRLRHTHTAAGKEAERQIADLQETLASARDRLTQSTRDIKRLTLCSPRGGTVLPSPSVKGMPHVASGPVGWSGTPLDRQNLGTWLKEGDQACYIGDPAELEAVLVIDQADIPFVREGQKVVLLLDALAGRTIVGIVAEISQGNLKISSRKLSTKHGGQLDTRSDPETGQERPTSPSYQASVLLDNSDHVLRLDMKGQARISVGSETLFTRSWRYLTHTFHFTL